MTYNANSNAAQQYLGQIDSTPQTEVARNIFTDTFNREKQESENFIRSEQSAQNQFYRDMAMQASANEFAAGEAQKNRDFQSKAYQIAVADMKAAGLNPILALGNGGIDLPTGSQASASSSRSSGGNHSPTRSDSNGLIMLISSLVGASANIASGLIQSGARKSIYEKSIKNYIKR